MNFNLEDSLQTDFIFWNNQGFCHNYNMVNELKSKNINQFLENIKSIENYNWHLLPEQFLELQIFLAQNYAICWNNKKSLKILESLEFLTHWKYWDENVLEMISFLKNFLASKIKH